MGRVSLYWEEPTKSRKGGSGVHGGLLGVLTLSPVPTGQHGNVWLPAGWHRCLWLLGFPDPPTLQNREAGVGAGIGAT